MSGGSWDYFYLKDSNLPVGAYAEMAKAVRDAGFDDAADRIQRAALALEEAQRIHRETADIMQAVEWRDSCDWGDDSIAKAVEKWRVKK